MTSLDLRYIAFLRCEFPAEVRASKDNERMKQKPMSTGAIAIVRSSSSSL